MTEFEQVLVCDPIDVDLYTSLDSALAQNVPNGVGLGIPFPFTVISVESKRADSSMTASS